MSVCKNCGESIELVNYSTGKTWMHNPPGYTGHKMGGGVYNVFRHCRKSVAEPVVNDRQSIARINAVNDDIARINAVRL